MAEKPPERIRPIHSFDPCMACACHTFDPRGNELGRGPKDVCLIGVIPACLEDGTGLSPALEAALDPVCRQALAELGRLGTVAERRAQPEASGSWWED